MDAAVNEKRFAARYPELGTGPVSVAPYISQTFFEKERDRVFRQHWLNVGRVDQIPAAGDYILVELPSLPASVIVVRGSDDRVRAFHNVCRHRGNRLVREAHGHAARFACGYHGWTYDRDGDLVNVPDQGQFHQLDKSQCGLRPVASDVWEGFLYVNLTPEPRETLRRALGEMYDKFNSYPFDEMSCAATYVAEVNANWKACMEIGEESYHVRFVHRITVPDSHTSTEDPFSRLPYVALYERHRSTSLCSNPEHQPSPTESWVIKFAPTVIQTGAQTVPPCLNPGRVENWAFDTHAFFPNYTVLLANDFFVTHRFWPVTVDRTRWETTLYTRRPRIVGERLSVEYSKVLTRDLTREDWAMIEKVYEGLATGANGSIFFSDQEILCRHGYEVLEAVVNGSD